MGQLQRGHQWTPLRVAMDQDHSQHVGAAAHMGQLERMHRYASVHATLTWLIVVVAPNPQKPFTPVFSYATRLKRDGHNAGRGAYA